MNDKPAGNSELNMFRVTESFLKGKHSEEDNEDAIFVGGTFAAVIDGATSKTTFRKDGKTTGQWAAQCVVEALRTLPAAATCQEAVSAVTRHIQRFYAIHHLEEQVENIRNSAVRPVPSFTVLSGRKSGRWGIAVA